MVRIQAGALAVLALALGGCGAEPSAAPVPPSAPDGRRLVAPDIAAADRLCRLLQDDPPAGVLEVRIRVPGSPSVTCVVRRADGGGRGESGRLSSARRT